MLKKMTFLKHGLHCTVYALTDESRFLVSVNYKRKITALHDRETSIIDFTQKTTFAETTLIYGTHTSQICTHIHKQAVWRLGSQYCHSSSLMPGPGSRRRAGEKIRQHSLPPGVSIIPPPFSKMEVISGAIFTTCFSRCNIFSQNDTHIML